MKDNLFGFALLAILFFLVGMKPSTWCPGPLVHGDGASDTRGEYFVLDGYKLRKFADHTLIKWYPKHRSLGCVMPEKLKNQYQSGENIMFRPDQDLEDAKLIKVSGQNSLFVWLNGKVHRLKNNFLPPSLHVEFPPEISLLEWENLDRGQRVMDAKLFLKLVEIPQPKPLWNGILLRGGTEERVYIIRNGMRFRFWSKWAFLRRGYRKDSIQKITDRVLYAIPFGGYLF